MLIEAVLVAKKPKGQGAGGGDACEGGAGEGGAGEGGAGEGGAGAGGAGEGALQKVHARRSSAYGNGGHDAVVLVEAVATMAIPFGPAVAWPIFVPSFLHLSIFGRLIGHPRTNGHHWGLVQR
jgi:hypothetical protein